MPEPASRASGTRATTETGPPVSGRTSSVALAVALALAEAVALALAVGVAEELAVGLAVGEAVGLAVGVEVGLVKPPCGTSGRSLAWQPSGVSLGKSGSGQGSSLRPSHRSEHQHS